jgi:hypothetical protein
MYISFSRCNSVYIHIYIYRYLDNNQLTELPSGLLSGIPSSAPLSRVSLTGNKLTCYPSYGDGRQQPHMDTSVTRPCRDAVSIWFPRQRENDMHDASSSLRALHMPVEWIWFANCQHSGNKTIMTDLLFISLHHCYHKDKLCFDVALFHLFSYSMYTRILHVCTCVSSSSLNCTSTESVSVFQLPWMSPRFQYSECIETRSWEDIAQQGPGDFFKTGGIDGLPYDMLAEWSTWACWKDHPCLSRLQEAVNGDFMCYVYNDLEDKWYPWAMNKEIVQHASCPAWTSMMQALGLTMQARDGA